MPWHVWLAKVFVLFTWEIAQQGCLDGTASTTLPHFYSDTNTWKERDEASIAMDSSSHCISIIFQHCSNKSKAVY